MNTDLGRRHRSMVIGFDLDMTLIDSRPGIAAVYDEIALETGVAIDSALVVSRLGPPPEWEMAQWFDAEYVPSAVRRYREIYRDLAIECVSALPGAADALTAARERGRVIVVTAKAPDSAQAHLDHLGLEVDTLHGLVWREGKADVLRAEGAVIYVGDHVHDIEAAKSACVTAVGVSTGACDVDQLFAAGADHVLSSLQEFPDFLFGGTIDNVATQ